MRIIPSYIRMYMEITGSGRHIKYKSGGAYVYLNRLEICVSGNEDFQGSKLA